ncbi:conserved hypothetical protein [Opitutus terrae PB90-1]|uniref:Uncharacterized protein n=2 Tax=Opitutus terrae TaxID=107709 RepID=B1ZPM3_OPITP|nr:conserved hypothetical protein [Opitutus terrae PB90-1]
MVSHTHTGPACGNAAGLRPAEKTFSRKDAMSTNPNPTNSNPDEAAPKAPAAHAPMPLPPTQSGSKFFQGGGRPGKAGPVQPRQFVGRGFARASHDHNRGRSK